MARWEVRNVLAFEIREPTTIVLSVAPAAVPGRVVHERFAGASPEPLGGRLHLLRVEEPGPLTLAYEATVEGGDAPAAGPVPFDEAAVDALRPSRYCPNDQLSGFAASTFGMRPPSSELAHEVADWVHGRLTYTSGSSRGTDSAVDTLLAGSGVCRDFAHLTVALCRALDLPARYVSVYAPGLAPMDFHAVAEVATPEGWELLDATRLAPRPSLLRIATGRDAADTAFVTTLFGRVDLVTSEVTAVLVGADLPADDHRGVVRLP